MPSMVTDQYLDASRLGRLADTNPLGHRVRHRLFYEHRHAGANASQRLLGMQLIRRCQDHAVGRVLPEHFVE